MDWDRTKQRAKEEQLLTFVAAEFARHGLGVEEAQRLAVAFMEKSVRISPPEEESHVVELILVNRAGRGGARSSKPGNIRFNLRALTDALATGTLGVAGVEAAPYLIPLVALVFWNAIWRGMNVELTEREAAVVYVMWMCKDARQEVPSSGLLQKVNDHLGKYGRSPLSAPDLHDALGQLERIRCIKKSSDSPGNWWLREWVQPTYR